MTTPTTLLISSGGGGAHKALAAYYSQRLPCSTKQQTFNIDFLEQPTTKVKKGKHYLHTTVLNKLFNWIQKTGRGYWLRRANFTRLFIWIIELIVYWRVKRNMLHMLEEHHTTEVINAQPINLAAIYNAIKEYAKKNPDKTISYKICSTDYFSAAMPYWDGIKSLPKTKPDNLHVTVTGPYSESADQLKKLTPDWVKFDTKRPEDYEINAGFYNPGRSNVSRIIYTDSGICWEDENINQAMNILPGNGIQTHRFKRSLNINPGEKLVQTLGSQGNITLASQVSRWFKNKAVKNSSLCIFAGKAYDGTVKKLTKVFKSAANVVYEDEICNNKHIATTVFKLEDGNSVQVVPFCPVALITEKMLAADSIVVKPSGQSTQQSVQLKAAAILRQKKSLATISARAPSCTVLENNHSNHHRKSQHHLKLQCFKPSIQSRI